ncbi:hypothetical protein, partial [Labrenzia sp. 011]|uniref:hypothetical protein n=1 Tax=Labrenzia sp. 011 TaxID=2171494 RepID=UPI000D50CFEC
MIIRKIINNYFGAYNNKLDDIIKKQIELEDRIKRDLSDKVVSRLRRIDKIDKEVVSERDRNK